MSDIPWTRFSDDLSKGTLKEPPYEEIYIQAPKEESKVIFYKRFGHHADNVTCEGCLEDYSVSQYNSLQDAFRDSYIDHQKDATMIIITHKEIKDEER